MNSKEVAERNSGPESNLSQSTNNGVGSRSLEGLHSTVPVPPASAGFWRQLAAFAGPAFLVSVGYMDPGNWGTDLEAGARFRYGLLWVVGLASLMAIIMQVISARLGIVTGKDLAQACRDYYPSWSRLPLWLICEVAIAACDLAEVLGSAVAINLLSFGHIPIFWAVIITAFDVLIILALQGLGMRFIEAVVLGLVATIGCCYFIEIFVLPQTQPNFLEMGHACLPPRLDQPGMLFLAIAIIGATVMPHNLYLHSALIHSRKFRTDEHAVKRAIRFNTIDTVAALSVAFLVNAGILVLAATVFNGKDGVRLPEGTEVEYVSEGENGKYIDPATKEELANDIDPETGKEIPPLKLAKFREDPDWIKVAFLTLSPLLGTGLASTLFAVALLASGQSSTITGTLAGQVVMEGFMHWRIKPWIRRLATRSIAIIPAVVIIGIRGERSSVTDLLNLSQAILALQLPFAMFPLLHFTTMSKWMGRYANGWLLLSAGWTSAIVITGLDIYGLPEVLEKAWRVIAD